MAALASPDQRGQAIRVTSPRSWVALLALLMLVATAIGWGVLGRIPTTVSARGVLVESPGYQITLVAYLPIGQAMSVKPGMPVRISPVAARPDEADSLRGVVRTVGKSPAGRAEMTRTLSSNALVEYFAKPGLVKELDVDLVSDDQAPGGATTPLASGTLCDVTIITGERAPLPLGR